MPSSSPEGKRLMADYAAAKRITDPTKRRDALDALIPRARFLTGTMSSTVKQILEDRKNAQQEIDKGNT